LVELPLVFWSLRTTSMRGTGYTPFFMVHGSEVVLPTDIDYGIPRVRAYTDERNQVSLKDAIDQLERHKTWHYCTRLGINRRCSVTMAAPSEKGRSKLGIWCYARSRATKITTSYHYHGKAPSSSTQSYVLTPRNLRMKTVDLAPMPGTSINCVVSTLKENKAFIFPIGKIA
jgi:hypothetical protein